VGFWLRIVTLWDVTDPTPNPSLEGEGGRRANFVSSPCTASHFG
jgi:hypothetical protein